MSRKFTSLKVISYCLSLLYATSALVYAAAVTVPDFRLHAIVLSLVYLALFVVSLSLAQLNSLARKRMVAINIVAAFYSILLLGPHEDFIQLSYIFVHLIVAVFFSQPTIAVQFIQGMAMTRKSILIVDDDEGLLKTVQRILLVNGYSVLTATSGEKGLQIARLQQPDLIILDVILPGVKGREVCARLKERPETKGIPVIFLTAKDSPDDIQAERAAGALSHLTKPVDPKMLLAELRKVFQS
ncbi:MAG: response regulator [Candidatus Omnitrophota bacterium]|nr:response regulator [Candidatus Omnitrophota bacterium]MDZ4241647.1 response regulator [Candidatus Omnitrophota bacterium]